MTWRRACAAYAVAHAGKSLLWTASDLLTLYVLVALYSVSPAIAGAVFLAGLAVNAVADLGVGVWLDRRPDRAALLAGTGLALAAAAFPATMVLAPAGPGALLAATLVFRLAYAGCDVPHNALMASLAPEPERAAVLARVRTVGTGAASLAAAWCVGHATASTVAPLLWTIAGAAALIGAAMVPLLVAFPLASRPDRGGRPRGLPLPADFLAASVIGIVALAALGKAVLHLPPGAAPADATTMVMLLIAGRTASAVIPLRFSGGGGGDRGLRLLAAAYVVAAAVTLCFAGAVAPALVALLGLAMGFANLVGWALLPALARGAGGFGLYTMASKLALGLAGVALAGGLGRAPAFTIDGLARFASVVSIACVVAALLAWPRLTPALRRLFSVG